MAQESIDQVAAVKASLELMVAENGEIHEYFRDLLEKVSELDEQPVEVRRIKFKDLVGMGAFRFNGLDIRHFTQSQHQPLPPPIFLSRTKRRLKNTLTLVDEFDKRGLFAGAGQLRSEIDLLSSHIINESDAREVRAFRNEVESLRASNLFQEYLSIKGAFIKQDAELRTEAEYLAAKESVEEGEEMFRQRAEDLESLSRDIESGSLALEEAQARLDEMGLPDESAAPDLDATDAEVEAGTDAEAATDAAQAPVDETATAEEAPGSEDADEESPPAGDAVAAKGS